MLQSTAYKFLAYYVTLFLFGVFGLGLSLGCFLVGWLPDSDATQRFFQRIIHRLFALFIWWMSLTRLFRLRCEGLERLPRGGLVLIANHPGLMDITYLLARIPEAVCIFKPAIRCNPVLGAAARRAGYLGSDGGLDLLRQAAAKVAEGHTLVIFPEGTRSRGGVLNPFKPGFALIARRAGVPIQLVHISCESNILTKGRAWWKLPQLPAQVVVTIGPLVSSDTAADTTTLAQQIEAWFRDKAGESPRPVSPSPAFLSSNSLSVAP